MKKRIAAILLAMLMVVSCAQAAEGNWAEGLSPQKPYTGSKEVDFNESIGFILLVPITGANTNPGELNWMIALPRTDIQLFGEGVISVFGKAEGLLEEIRMDDSENVILREMTEEERESLIWGCGTMIEIKTGVQMEANSSYYVNMTEGCIVSEE